MFVVVMVTVPSQKASSIAKSLLKQRLCACVNIIGKVDSYFWWDKKIDRAKESLLIIKTRKRLFGKLEKAVRKIHPYTVPEIISIKMDGISRPYRDWMLEETKNARCPYKPR